jgi:hypothetical protein
MARYQLVVLVGQAEWRVVLFRGWRYQALYVFSADADKQRLLLDDLQRYASANLYFLTDIAEEHYHIETWPLVRGTARKQLLARRLAAWPFAQGLHAVHRVGGTAGPAQADRYLFSAIHCPPLSQLLQAQSQEKPLRVQGVYTQALCCPYWASPLQSGHRQCLIAYFEKQQLRLRYLYQSQLVFSRLLTLEPDASLNLRISSEIVQTRLYLLSQQWLQEGEPLQLLWLRPDGHDHDVSPEQLPAAIPQTVVSYAEMLHQSGWQSVPDGLSVMDWLAIQVVLHSRRLPNLAPEQVLLSAHMVRAKRMLVAACMVTFVLLLAANYLSQQAMQKTRSDIRRTSAQLHLWQSAQPAWGITDADLSRLQTFSQAVQNLQAAVRYPDRALMIVQQVMAGQQAWQVNKIDWVYAATAEAKSEATSVSEHAQNVLAEPQSAETGTLRFARQKNVSAADAQREWPLLLEKLRQHPHMLALKETRATSTSASQPQQGDTRLSAAPDHQPVVSFSLRPLESHAN